jgi:hypothetical protein
MAVAVMALTGLLNSIFMVGSFRALLTSAYGQLLVSKLILFFVMVGFGAWNLFLLKPRLAVDLPNMNVADQKSAIRSLVRNVLCEVGLGAAVILIVAALGITPPPLHQLAVEKDFPEGMEPALSARQIHYIPSEVENRLPDFCVDGNDCWLVGSQQTQEELLCVPSSEDSACSGLHHSIDGLPAWIGKEQECKRFCS